MKKLVIAVLAIGAMAACTKSNIQYEQPEEISFQPVAKKATKVVNGAIDETEYPEDENFNVWSWWTSKEAGTSIGSIANGFDGDFDMTNTNPDEPILYINEGTFAHRAGTSNWGGVTPYYWPTTGSLVFAGYSPSDASSSDNTFNYDFKNQIFTVTDYIQSSDIKETVDLMWFDADESYKKNGAVNVTFNHALSWLEFRFNLVEDARQNWKIHKVYLKGIETKASFTSKGANSKPSWTTDPSSTEEQLIVYENEGGLKLNIYSPLYDNLSDVAKKGVVVIPQSCAPANGGSTAAAELVIEYGLLTPATAGNSEDKKVYIDQSVTLHLNYICNTEHNPGHDGYMWEPGCHYIYTITFGANEILISPSVEKWTDETENIDVV